jgi:hypothetical protein
MDLHYDKSLDTWLDKALQQHGAAEARPGLEARIFANLAANSSTERPVRKWGWTLPFATSLILVFSVWLTYHGRLLNTRPNVLSNRPGTMHIGPVHRPLEPAQSPESREVIAGVRAEKIYPRASRRLANVPRLPQFPSQRPLSEQEQLLKQYVEQCPGEAMVVARAQTEIQKELDKLVADGWSKTDSDEQER